MALRSHCAPCIFWPPISYYFFGFDLLSFCPLQAAIQPHWPVAFLSLTVPQIFQSCIFLESLAWHCTLQKYFFLQLLLCISSSSLSNLFSNITFLMKLYLNCLIPNPHLGIPSSLIYLFSLYYNLLQKNIILIVYPISHQQKSILSIHTPNVFSCYYIPLGMSPKLSHLFCNYPWLKRIFPIKVSTIPREAPTVIGR